MVFSIRNAAGRARGTARAGFAWLIEAAAAAAIVAAVVGCAALILERLTL